MSDYSIQQQNTNVEDDEIVIDIGRLLSGVKKGLKKFWWCIVVICIAIALVLCGIYAFRYIPKYEARSSFTVSTLNGNSEIDATYGFDYSARTAEQLTTLFPYILDSDILQELVKDSLGTDSINGEMHVSSVSDSNLFTISVISDSPDEAGEILEAVMQYIPEVSQYVIGETKLNVIQQAKLSSTPCNQPNYGKLAGTGIAIGVVISLLLLLVYSLMCKTIRKEEDFREQLNIRCLGSIPQIKGAGRKSGKNRIISIQDRKKDWQLMESVRGLCLKVERRMAENNEKILMITSTLPGEGKTMTALNLALALEEKGKKVLLLDMDLRNPSLCKDLKVPAEALTIIQVLEGKKSIEKAICQLETGMYFLGSEKSSGNPMQLLTSPVFGQLLEEYREKVDYIIVDTPPCGIISDAATISESCEAILYVIRRDTAKQTVILDSIQRLASHGKHVVGGILNCADKNEAGYGRYGYGKYGYGKYGYGKYGYGRYGSDETKGKKP